MYTFCHLQENANDTLHDDHMFASITQRHILHLLAQCFPITRLQFGILHPLLTPVLMQLADMILALLKVRQFIPYAFLDENAPRMLIDD